jgi:hypothetical protein
MNLLMAVVFAHYIADWALQTEFVARNKGKYGYIMFSHSMVWTGVICFVLNYYNAYSLWKLVFLLVGHMWMDQYKMDRVKEDCSASRETEKHNLRLLYIDQAWHFVQCVVVSIF